MASRAIVIGGGIIGCAVAHELARRRWQVELVADRALAQGATQASGGMLVPYVEVHTQGPMLDLGVRSLALYEEFVARARAEAGADADAFEYARNGSLQVAFREDDVRLLQDAAMWMGANQVACDWIAGRELRRLEPALAENALGGLLVHEHGVVGAERLTESLWAAALAHGARFTPSQVRSLARNGSVWIAEGSAGQLEADVVVLAAGAWAGAIQIDGLASPPVVPVRGQLLYLRWVGEPLERVIWGPRCYLIPWSDGTLLVGATLEHVGFDVRNTVAGVHDLLDGAAELVPSTWNASFLGARAGLRPGTPDDCPVLGARRDAPGLIYAVGHYRNGVLLAPITASLLGDLIVDGVEHDLLHPFLPDRFGVLHG
jgi:glycine oxidase